MHCTFSQCQLKCALIHNSLCSPIEHNNLSTISVRADSEDKVPLKSVKLGSKDYDLKPLPKSDQGLYSDAYDIVGDFEKFPAILKVVNVPKGSEALDQTRKEIRFLTKVAFTTIFTADARFTFT